MWRDLALQVDKMPGLNEINPRLLKEPKEEIAEVWLSFPLHSGYRCGSEMSYIISFYKKDKMVWT